jgi:endo-1,4-beta-xylanase
MSHYAGKVYAWDVVNEAFNDDGSMRSTIWYDQPGIGFAGMGTKYIEQALNWARAADPNAKLFYNDYNAEVMDAKSDAIYAMAQDFKNRGVPLDGVGFQFHIDLTFDNPTTLASVASNFQRFAALGLDVHITELDIRVSDSSAASLNAQAKLYGEIAAICVQQPACKLFQTWGFTDKHSWIPSFYPGMGWALLWDANYQKKPAYASVLNSLR